MAHVLPSAVGEVAPEAAPSVDLSVVVPAYNEAASLTELVEAIATALAGSGLSYDVWIVDDGSDDGTFTVIEQLARRRPELHGLCLGRNFGKAAALAAGFAHARGAIVVTMDADLQDDPAEIQRLVAKIDEGFDLVSGWKQDRKDSFVKNQTSKLFNWVTGWVCGLRLHDFNCGLKVYRREVTHSLRLYGEMHRFTPALAHLSGYAVTELPVCHHARKYGRTTSTAVRSTGSTAS
jgi:glycosyltransferase involved in cell wall biosynthesis